MEYEPVIGLEVHIELKTESKMFCGCPADYFGLEPNTLTCPVCLGLPGALPVPNRRAVEWTILLGKALGCKINRQSKFYRKNYFYPDLPKGYQITQYDEPLAVEGALEIDIQEPVSKADNSVENRKKIRIRRVHLEEDTGKLIHEAIGGKDYTLVDFNRSGVPLVEIVTEPDLRSSEEAKIFLKEIQKIVRYLNISEADMEKGTMRLEPSVSLREKGSQDLPPYRVEIKNINSFRFAKRAIEYEMKRQKEILEKGDVVMQETRGWNEDRGVTVFQRAKEEAHDYRYFPEPDIPPLDFSEADIMGIIESLPELPRQKVERYVRDHGMKRSDALILTETTDLAILFEELVKMSRGTAVSAQKIATSLVNRRVNFEGRGVTEVFLEIEHDAKLTAAVPMADLSGICREVIEENPSVVKDYRAGKEKSLEYLIGQVFRKLKEIGRPNPDKVREVLMKMLENG